MKIQKISAILKDILTVFISKNKWKNLYEWVKDETLSFTG